MSHRISPLHFVETVMTGYVRGHSIRVGETVPLDMATAGYLHDAVEDGYLGLRAVGYLFGLDTMAAVDAVSRRPAETYRKFVVRAAKHPVGGIVKLADLLDNIGTLPETDSRYERYAWAISYLLAALEEIPEGLKIRAKAVEE